MKRTPINKAGFSHVMLIGAVLVLGLIGLAGYRTYQAYHEVKSVAYEGTLQKQKCTDATPDCTGYSLTTDNAKIYNLVLPSSSTPPPASNTKVAVTGTMPSSGSSVQSTITVKTIAPTAPATQQDPLPSYIKGNVYITYTCGNVPRGGTCSNQPSPYQATIAVETTDGALIKNVTSSSDGSFSLTILAGTYLLVPNSYSSGQVRASQQTVTVKEGDTTSATINYEGLLP